MKIRNVFSGFDGKSSGYTALDLAGVEFDGYYSSEVDKYAIQVSEAIHQNQTRLGDITKWREWDVDWSTFDLIMAGSPCQGFSFAGKQLAFDDPRSKLFFVFVDILNHVKALNPDVKFLLENVKMKKEFMQVIDEQLGVESILINSALVSAQNRQRLYWSNIPIDEPIDRVIDLESILENTIDLPIGVYVRNKSKCVRVGGSNSPFGSKQEWDSPFYIDKSKGFYGIYFKHPLLSSRYTARERFRLQTTPEHIIDKILACGVSNSQLYKIAGNGWTDEVITHIFRGL